VTHPPVGAYTAIMNMGGMSMSMGGMFTPTNMSIAHAFWYIIAAFVGLLTVIRCTSWYQSRRRRAAHSKGLQQVPSRPEGYLAQLYATATATMRELAYPQPIVFTGRFSKYFTPPPIGRCLVLAIYWIVILTMLWSNTILTKGSSEYAYKWEKVGFRAAWVSVAQIPFIYLLSCKFNPISILTGISYERLNWLHRWAARTVFLTLIVHWSFFYQEWVIADFVKLQFEMMPMVKYGFGAWGVITWQVLSGFGFFRAASYEIFVAQHIVAAAVLLWLIFIHVPQYARYNVWMCVAFLVFDWGCRIIHGFLRNTHLMSKLATKTPGYSASTESLPGNMVRLSLEDVDFSWKAGQHVYISMPSLRPFELHPFTIANAANLDEPAGNRRLTFLIKAHGGFSRSLQKAAAKDAQAGRKRRVFLMGPWGMPPDLLQYETVVLIACASGASFIVPLLQDLVLKQGCVQRVQLHWIVRSRENASWYQTELEALNAAARSARLQLQITVHITQSSASDSDSDDFTPLPSTSSSSSSNSDTNTPPRTTTLPAAASGSSGSSRSTSLSSPPNQTDEKDNKIPSSTTHEKTHSHNYSKPSISVLSASRPTVESMIRPPVEAALGETAVVTCGGAEITAQARTFVARLSDERAVHKGTGAQGIYLFTETYGW
jgi:NAD(P)H-flavin reductase